MPIDKSAVTIVDNKFEVKTVEDLLLKYLHEIITGLTRELKSAKKDQPGVLLQSIGENSDVEYEGDKMTIFIGMEDYWKYVNYGVNGTDSSNGSKYNFKNKQPPEDEMLEFINTNNKVKAWARTLIAKKKLKKTQKKVKSKRIKKAVKQISTEKAYKQAAFLIGRGIKRKGIKPTNFYDNIINDALVQRLTNDLSKAFQKDIEIHFKPSKNGS